MVGEEEPFAVPVSWWALVEARARVSPDAPLFADDRGRRMTMREHHDAACRVAAALWERGIRPGSVVSWQLPTSLESVVLMSALTRVGATQNPIIAILREAEVAFIVEQIRADLLVVPRAWRGHDHASMAEAVAARHGCDVLVCDIGADDLALPVADPSVLPPPETVAPADARTVRWIFYSSGTTGRPKGAKHSDQSLMHGSNGIVHNVGINAADVFPIAYPMPHIGGPTFVAAQFRTGAATLLVEAFDAVQSPRHMAEAGATMLGSAVPFYLAYIAAQRAHGEAPLFPRLRSCPGGGAPTPPEIAIQTRVVLGGAGVLSGYGLTEFPVATFAAHEDPLEERISTNGRPTVGVDVRIVGPDGIDVEPGTEGEVRLRGPQMCLGYVDPSLDADAFDEQGSFRTGDLGRVDAYGSLLITGRVKDLIIRNAENLSAVEIENALCSCPGVADVAVIGVPDARTGERACAIVVPEGGATAVTLAGLAEHCRALGLASQKFPEQLELVAELPRNPQGKLLKNELRARFAEPRR
jgi:acyl-CoA synthetase (AMP-forming)/AMP-acid ligase II